MFPFRNNKLLATVLVALTPVAWAQPAAPVIEWTPASAYTDSHGTRDSAPWLITDLAAKDPVIHALSPMPGSAPAAMSAWGEQVGVSGLWRLGGGLSWQVELHKSGDGGLGQPPSPVATIQCERGWLGASSMTGRNCRVTGFEQSHAAMRGLWSPLPGLQTQLSMFRRSEARSRPSYLDAFGSGLALLNEPPIGATDYLGREYAGVDFGLRFEFPVSTIGRLAVDADVARILDYSVEAPGADLSLAGPIPGASSRRDRDFARLQLDWSRGEFSGGIESLYREVPPFDRGRSESSDWTSFNLHFTWRTPWDGALSLGATNFLDDSPDDRSSADPGNDPFDSIYGRIPYVRYKQDL